MTQEDIGKLMYASDEDIAFYKKAIIGLSSHAGIRGDGFDAEGVQIPYSCGYHSVRCLRQAMEVVKPKCIFEIGTNLCCSAALFLELSPDVTIATCDITTKKETLDSVEVMKERYGERFNYYNRNSQEYINDVDSLWEYQMAFVDGSHHKKDVEKDIDECLRMNIPYILFDDVMPEFGTVQEAVDKYECLENVFINGNIALYKNKTI